MRSGLKQVLFYVANFLRWWNKTYLRLNGVQIGRNKMICLDGTVDSQQDKVNIGDNCYITYGSVILSHDGTAKQLCAGDGGVGAVIIGNNVFVGVNVVIVQNVRIWSNRVIIAGAVVTTDIPANSLVVGNPRR